MNKPTRHSVKNPAYKTAIVLGEIKPVFDAGWHMTENCTVSHLFTCQAIASDLRNAGVTFDRYRFSKLCGYDFTI